MAAAISAFPKAVMTANMLMLVMLVDGWKSKNFQDGSLIVTLGNGPKQD